MKGLHVRNCHSACRHYPCQHVEGSSSSILASAFHELVTMMLTGAARPFYLVASDSMPKIGTVTLISRLYLSSFIHNFIALIVTV